MPVPRSRFVLAFLATATLTGCVRDDRPNPVRDAFAQRPPPTTVARPLVFHFPDAPQTPVRLYQLPDFEELSWRFDDRDLSTASIVGFSSDEDMVFFRSPIGALRSLELASGRVRTLDTLAALTTIGPTSTLFTVRADSTMGRIVDRRLDLWTDTLPAIPERIWGTTRGRMVALFRDETGPYLTHLADPWDRDRIDIPEGPIAMTAWGDFLAIVTETEIVGIRLSTPDRRLSISPRGPVTAVAFSASAHRLYYLVDGNHLFAVNRFDFEAILDTQLIGKLDDIHSDPFGRYLLGRPEGGDSVIVLEARDGRRLAAVAAEWTGDLPATTEDGMLLLRRGTDIVAFDPLTSTESGRLSNATGKLILVPWDPSRPTLQLMAETEDAEEEEQAGDRIFYAQLGSTSNLAWAQDRVDGLVGAGLPARVVLPSEFDDRYRLVLGPYNSRAETEDNARKLGQAYFIISFDRSDTTVTYR